MKFKLLILMLFLSGCHQSLNDPDDFVLCSNEHGRYWNVAIDFEEKRGRWADEIRPVKACDASRNDCLLFPILLSVPPAFPEKKNDVVNWSVGAVEYSMKKKENKYEIIVINSDVKYVYTYDEYGVLSMSMREGEAEADTWRRCKGKFKFSDIESLL